MEARQFFRGKTTPNVHDTSLSEEMAWRCEAKCAPLVAWAPRSLLSSAERSGGGVGEPMTTDSFADFERALGGLWAESPMSYTIRDFCLNGGNHAIIVRLHKPPACTNGAGRLNVDNLKLDAANPVSGVINCKSQRTTGVSPMRWLAATVRRKRTPMTQL
jgi:hypothetical protein